MAFPRLFRIFYSTLFTILNIVLLGLLLITPADAINQALANKQLYNVFAIAGCYLLTLIIVVIIYASRLYTNRTVLASIPKTWIPVEKGDVGKRVRRMIVDSLSRSALIAWNARPRVSNHTNAALSEVDAQGANPRTSETKEKRSKVYQVLHKKRVLSEKDERAILVPHRPVWGEISHEGWSPPTSTDLPNLQYVTVVFELPHLIEAKAVSLAPPDAVSTTLPPMPDLRAIELLQRPAAMGLRDYIGHLTSLGIIPATTPVNAFLSAYETARFSPKPRTESQFRYLMRLFAEILRSMTPLDPAILSSLSSDDLESDIDNDATSTTTSEAEGGRKPRSRSLASSRSDGDGAASRSTSQGSQGTIRTAPSRNRHRDTTRSNSQGTGTGTGIGLGPGSALMMTAPTTPKSKKRERFIERSASAQSFSQTRKPYALSQASSSSSLRSGRRVARPVSAGSASGSGSGSGSGESVIKLNRNAEAGELPYVLQVDG